jgi:hypothetical protein
VLLRNATDCAPCGRFVCNRQAECLDISPERVLDAVRDVLAIPAGIAQ